MKNVQALFQYNNYLICGEGEKGQKDRETEKEIDIHNKMEIQKGRQIKRSDTHRQKEQNKTDTAKGTAALQ